MGQALKIEQKITGFQVASKDEAAAVAPVVAAVTPIRTEPEILARPEKLEGVTYKLKTPTTTNALYITINHYRINEGTDEERLVPFEIFLNSKSMEHYQWIVALTRVISAVFRKGGDVSFLVEELRSVFDPNGGYFKKGGEWVPSLIAEIGGVIETHLIDIGHIKKEAMPEHVRKILDEKRAKAEGKTVAPEEPESAASFPANATVCGKCSMKAVTMDGGCATCLNCGDSKCQ